MIRKYTIVSVQSKESFFNVEVVTSAVPHKLSHFVHLLRCQVDPSWWLTAAAAPRNNYVYPLLYGINIILYL